MDRNKTREHLSFERIVFFSDAVFAIAITLLVIEIKVPIIQTLNSEKELSAALLQSIPKIVGFIISFFLIGQTWIEHHRIFSFIERSSTGLLWKNLLLLLFVAFLPFATAVMSEYYWSETAICLYAFTFAFLGIAKAFLWRYAAGKYLLYIDVDKLSVKKISRRVWASPIASFVVILLSVFRVPLSYSFFMFIPLIALLLDRSIKKL